MPAFLKGYGELNHKTGEYILSAKTQSLVTSMINVGEFIGAVSSYLIGDKLGRKGSLYVSSTAVVVGYTASRC